MMKKLTEYRYIAKNQNIIDNQNVPKKVYEILFAHPSPTSLRNVHANGHSPITINRVSNITCVSIKTYGELRVKEN